MSTNGLRRALGQNCNRMVDRSPTFAAKCPCCQHVEILAISVHYFRRQSKNTKKTCFFEKYHKSKKSMFRKKPPTPKILTISKIKNFVIQNYLLCTAYSKMGSYGSETENILRAEYAHLLNPFIIKKIVIFRKSDFFNCVTVTNSWHAPPHPIKKMSQTPPSLRRSQLELARVSSSWNVLGTGGYIEENQNFDHHNSKTN